MIFIAAQPDRVKFLWQLKVQLWNFKKMGIDPACVHYIVGIDGDQPSEGFQKFARDSGARVFFYPNTASKTAGYLSLVRPNILAQHFEQYPGLKDYYLFYLDSDVLFSRPMDFSVFERNGDWYVSDTRNYIWSKYIQGAAGTKVLLDMCRIVGIEPEWVIANDEGAGGAQYIIQGVDAAYWKKVERDAENLFVTISRNTPMYEGLRLEEFDREAGRARRNHASQATIDGILKQKAAYQKLQIWCADMWSVLWNGWLLGRKSVIRPELTFSWGTSSVQEYEQRPLFHYAGVDAHSNQPVINGIPNLRYPHFDKYKYDQREPFGDDFSDINPISATIKLVEHIKEIQDAKWLTD